MFDDIGAETGTLVYPKDPVYTPNHAANHAANHGPKRASRSFTVPCSPLNSAGNSLGLAYNWKKKHRSHNSSSADKTADHDDSLLGD